MTVTASSSGLVRFFAYLRERFPVGAYGVLTALYVMGAWSVAAQDISLERATFFGTGSVSALAIKLVLAFANVLCVFFHLRIFDEMKDAKKDAIAHPERLVQRGIVTRANLITWGVVAIVVEAVTAGVLGVPALIAWACVFIFSVGMRVEFFIGSFIEPRPLTYAVTHQPIMFLLAAFVYVAAGVPASHLCDRMLLLHQVASFGGLFAFEIARKLRAPEDETATELTYSKAHGPKRAAAVAASLLLAAIVASAALASWFLVVATVALAAYAIYAFAPTKKNSKLQNLVTSLALLAIHGALTATLFCELPQLPGAPSDLASQALPSSPSPSPASSPGAPSQ